MKILLLWNYYDSYLRRFHLQNPGTHLLSYRDQNRFLLDDGFNWPAYLIPEFEKLGHKAAAIVGNADYAQEMWVQERGVDLPGDGDRRRNNIVREQIREFQPDILWIGGGDLYFGGFLQSVRRYCGKVVAWRAASGGERLDWTGVSCVLSSHMNFVEQFRSMGLRSERLLPCADAVLVDACSSQVKERGRDVVFYGTLSPTLFTNRLATLSSVTSRVECHIHSDRLTWQRRPLPLRSFLSQLRFVPFTLRTRMESPVYGRELLQLLAASKIVLNAHVDSAAGLAGNIRMFEATAMGCLLLTDASANLSEIFEPGKEIATYRNANEAVDLIRHYLKHPEEREQVARSGQRRTLQTYNSAIRAAEALSIFSDLAQ